MTTQSDFFQEHTVKLQESLKEAFKGLTRCNDHETSKQAAKAIKPHLSELQACVMEAFQLHRSGLTDEQLEGLGGFQKYAPGTIRKRRTELTQQGRIEACGKQSNSRGSMVIRWRLV